MIKKILQYNLLFILPLLVIFVLVFSVVPTYNVFNEGDHTNKRFAEEHQYHYQILSSHQFQNYLEKILTERLRLRNIFITAHNQFYYSFFKKSYSENRHIIIGKHNQIFEIDYINLYCRREIDPKQLTEWVNKIKQIQQYFIARGKIFIYIITPSKAEYMYQNIPNRFQCHNTGVRPEINRLEKLLTENNIPHVNAPLLMEATKQTYPVPMFQQGGIHWNWLAAGIAANAVIDILNTNYKMDMKPINLQYKLSKITKLDSDDDILKITKVSYTKISKLSPHLIYKNQDLMKPLKLAVVGGSFNELLIRTFQDNQMFQTADHVWYFNSNHFYQKGVIEKKEPAVNLEKILNADVVFLEENSSLIISDHGRRFYDALRLSS